MKAGDELTLDYGPAFLFDAPDTAITNLSDPSANSAVPQSGAPQFGFRLGSMHERPKLHWDGRSGRFASA